MSTDTTSEPDWSPTFYRTSNQRLARTEFTYSRTHIIVKFKEKVAHGLDGTLPFFNFAFYAVAIHTAYFLYIHYTMSFHRTVPDPNWFQIPFAVITGVLLVLQASAFIKTIAGQRHGSAVAG